MRYEDKVRHICGDDWKTVNAEEKEGGFGVACMMAYIRGCRPSAMDLARHLDVPIDDIVAPHGRLSRTGMFDKNWGEVKDETGEVIKEGGAKRDESLNGQLGDDEYYRAWSHVAAIASGFIGVC